MARDVVARSSSVPVRGPGPGGRTGPGDGAARVVAARVRAVAGKRAGLGVQAAVADPRAQVRNGVPASWTRQASGWCAWAGTTPSARRDVTNASSTGLGCRRRGDLVLVCAGW